MNNENMDADVKRFMKDTSIRKLRLSHNASFRQSLGLGLNPSESQTAPELRTRCPESPSTTTPQPSGRSEPVWMETLKKALQETIAAAVPASPQQRSRVAFIDEANSLEMFSGHDELMPVKTWTKIVDDLATISGWNEYETYFAAKRALTGAAADWVMTRSDLQSWKQLKVALESTFRHTVDEYQIMERLRKERPRPNVPLIQYAHRMRRYASLVGISEKSTIAYIVNGIFSSNAFEKTQLRACESFDKLGDMLAVYEAARREKKKHQKKSKLHVMSSKTGFYDILQELIDDIRLPLCMMICSLLGLICISILLLLMIH
ncbi:hypothetical protein TSAR_001533 [Trichomalopsis sarcophagae]|uniref:Retrotransposon gag domain-containing protein n=1 Tax=Trichomalopsis sarcophagae TaxID=543379 RepID=A0A232F9X1_9HYME|nr:hypothetical protein TSAR_001533 [Trichomalopsis sarcophagae]